MRFSPARSQQLRPRQPQTFSLPTQFRAPHWGLGTSLPTAQEGQGLSGDFSIAPNLQSTEPHSCTAFLGSAPRRGHVLLMTKPQSWSALSFVVPPAPKASRAQGICWNQLKPSMGIGLGLSRPRPNHPSPPSPPHPFQTDLRAPRRKTDASIGERTRVPGQGSPTAQGRGETGPRVQNGWRRPIPSPRKLFPDGGA